MHADVLLTLQANRSRYQPPTLKALRIALIW
jgi:hypothetical protein